MKNLKGNREPAAAEASAGRQGTAHRYLGCLIRIWLFFWALSSLPCSLFPHERAWAQSENDFYRDILRKEIVSQEELVRAVARFKGYHGADNIESELGFLYQAGVRFPRDIRYIARRPATKGEAANAFLNAMQDAADQRGLFGRLFTRSRRFAARDGMAQKILPNDSYANEYISGAELMAMLGRAVEQMEKRP